MQHLKQSKILHNYKSNNAYRYRSCIAAHVELIDPAVETAKEAFIALRTTQLNNNVGKNKNQFFITIPNKNLQEVKLQPDGWFTYEYKYGRSANENKKFVQFVPFDDKNISPATYGRLKAALPNVYRAIRPGTSQYK